MPKRCAAVPPSDKEILGYSNVPVTVAAKYVGSSSTTIMWALQEERAPYGYATQNPKTGTCVDTDTPSLSSATPHLPLHQKHKPPDSLPDPLFLLLLAGSLLWRLS